MQAASNLIVGSLLVFRGQRKTPQASWVERNVLIVVLAQLSLVKINLVWLRLLGGLIGTILQTIQLITVTLWRNECHTKGSPLDILLIIILFNIIISSLSMLALVITEKPAR